MSMYEIFDRARCISRFLYHQRPWRTCPWYYTPSQPLITIAKNVKGMLKRNETIRSLKFKPSGPWVYLGGCSWFNPLPNESVSVIKAKTTVNISPNQWKNPKSKTPDWSHNSQVVQCGSIAHAAVRQTTVIGQCLKCERKCRPIRISIVTTQRVPEKSRAVCGEVTPKDIYAYRL